ncbi:unnamed protein product [Adineta ricciae]|uniref:Transmembrane protein 237 n=1 Tax=Adineta ricciae TaxID=249248 RepID=A0A815BWZ0_ADIRI|nr:unnamed protein product [Adineta ricciae]
MATASSSQGETQRRRLPKLTPPNPVSASSDETPRTTTGEDTARERRRARQRLAHEGTPDGREIASPPTVKDTSLPPRSNPGDDRQTTKRRKARRRIKSSSNTEQEPSLLRGFEDEVIVEKSKKSNELVLPDLLLSSTYAGTTPSKSAPTPRIYFEDKNKFSSVNKDAATVRLGNRSGQSPFTLGYDDHHTFQQQTAEVLKRFTVQVAKQTHSALQKFFLFIHGINAGYALWVCVFAFVFTNDNSICQFFQVYRNIALITHLLFYIFLAICMVDVLDRIDPVKFSGTVLLQTITAQNSGPALLLYTVAMVVNLVMMETEDYLRVSQYTENLSGSNITVAYAVSHYQDSWRTLTAVRAAFSVVAWFIVSINAKNDRLSLMIKNTEDKAFYEELKIEQNIVPLTTGITSP